MPPALTRARLLLSAVAVASFTGLWAVGCGDDATTNPPEVASCTSDPGAICTWAGTGLAAFDGDGNPLIKSTFYWPVDMIFTSQGVPYILDWNNHRVREVTAQGTLRTVIGTDFVGDGPEDQSDLVAPGAVGTTVDLNHPTDLLEMPDGTILLTAWHNHKLRRYDPATGLVLVVCGAGAGYRGDGGPMVDALLNQPAQTVMASDGSLFVLDQRNQRVRKITPAGTVSTVVGTGEVGYAGDGGPPLQAKLNLPTGTNPSNFPAIAIDDQDRLYISDLNNHRIRRVDFSLDRIETLVGTGSPGYSGDGGPASAARINSPRDVEIGPDGNLWFADELNHRIRKVDLATGIVTTVVGTGEQGYSGDGGPASEAKLYRPQGIAFDAAGHLYVMDTYNHVIRRVNL